MLQYIVEKHAYFLEDIQFASKLFVHSFTAFPTCVFLSFSAILLFLHFHRYTNRYTKWHVRLGRDIRFQWVFFYISRGWFLLIRLFKLLHQHLMMSIDALVPENEKEANEFLAKFMIMTTVSLLSLIPVIIFCAKYFCRNDVPNFLMWVEEDPWLRSEMGMSGHLLEQRSPSLPVMKGRDLDLAFRSGRSTSVDADIYKESSRPRPLRPCRSIPAELDRVYRIITRP